MLPSSGSMLPSSSSITCVHAPRCPGCPLIGRPYPEGLASKAAHLDVAFARYPELATVERLPVVPADVVVNYRLRAKLVADERGHLGLYAAGSHDVVDIPHCRVMAPELSRVAQALRELLPLELPLTGVDLRLCDRGVLVCLVVTGQPAKHAVERCRDSLIARLPQLAGLAVSFRKPGAVQMLGTELTLLSGPEAQPHHLYPGGVWHYASHGAFTQVHSTRAAWLHERIQALLEQGNGLAGLRVLELYAGSGALALRLAAAGARVTAVESFAPALERLGNAASAQALTLETWCGDAEEFLAGLNVEGVAAPRFDAVLVNPPRRGLTPNVRMRLAELAPARIVYVSCEPETLARDLSHFAALGYSCDGVQGLDMIPLSESLESVVALEQKPAARPRVLFEDACSLALDKLPFEATARQGTLERDLLARARQALGLPELTPVHRLDRDTSGVCWFARRPDDVPALAAALAEGELRIVALAHGVVREKGKINRPIRDGAKAKPAQTRYRRDAVIGGHSLLSVWTEHSRKHQLRRHLASIRHPVVGDARYGQRATNLHFEHRHGLERTCLHCASLRVDLGAGPVEIRSELAGDLAAVLDSLRR